MLKYDDFPSFSSNRTENVPKLHERLAFNFEFSRILQFFVTVLFQI